MSRVAHVCVLAALFAAACGDDAKTSDSGTSADVASDADLTGKSVYHLELTIDGDTIVIDRDLTGLSQYFAFGSTHIAPAVSFGVTDSIQFPRTMTNTLNFGIVVPSDDHPVQTQGTGTYLFSASPPNLDVFVSGLQYRSTNSGAAGELVIDAWGVDEGETVSGTFSGALVADGPSGLTIDVFGSFHFVLPAKNAGQPGP